jgi:hypothetical protein
MIDLSHLLGDPISALVPTGQATADQRGNQAQTAPGSVPAAPHADNPAPVVEAIAHTETALKDGHDTGLDGGPPMLKMRTAGRSYPNMNGPEGTAAALRNSNPAREQR